MGNQTGKTAEEVKEMTKEAVEQAVRKVDGSWLDEKIQSEFNRLLNSSYYKEYFGYDCSEIAQDFYDIAQQKGVIYRIEGKNGYINGYEYGFQVEYYYHEVYSDGIYIYDPRYINEPVLKDDYFKALKDINPDGFDVFEKKD